MSFEIQTIADEYCETSKIGCIHAMNQWWPTPMHNMNKWQCVTCYVMFKSFLNAFPMGPAFAFSGRALDSPRARLKHVKVHAAL